MTCWIKNGHLFGPRIILQQVYTARSGSPKNTRLWAGIRLTKLMIDRGKNIVVVTLLNGSSQVVSCGSYSGVSKSAQSFVKCADVAPSISWLKADFTMRPPQM